MIPCISFARLGHFTSVRFPLGGVGATQDQSPGGTVGLTTRTGFSEVRRPESGPGLEGMFHVKHERCPPPQKSHRGPRSKRRFTMFHVKHYCSPARRDCFHLVGASPRGTQRSPAFHVKHRQKTPCCPRRFQIDSAHNGHGAEHVHSQFRRTNDWLRSDDSPLGGIFPVITYRRTS